MTPLWRHFVARVNDSVLHAAKPLSGGPFKHIFWSLVGLGSAPSSVTNVLILFLRFCRRHDCSETTNRVALRFTWPFAVARSKYWQLPIPAKFGFFYAKTFSRSVLFMSPGGSSHDEEFRPSRRLAKWTLDHIWCGFSGVARADRNASLFMHKHDWINEMMSCVIKSVIWKL